MALYQLVPGNSFYQPEPCKVYGRGGGRGGIYHISGEFGEDFNLAVWQIVKKSEN